MGKIHELLDIYRKEVMTKIPSVESAKLLESLNLGQKYRQSFFIEAKEGEYRKLEEKAEKMGIIKFPHPEDESISTIPLEFEEIVEIGKQPYVEKFQKVQTINILEKGHPGI